MVVMTDVRSIIYSQCKNQLMTRLLAAQYSVYRYPQGYTLLQYIPKSQPEDNSTHFLHSFSLSLFLSFHFWGTVPLKY
ncbi:hypothetical protein EUGRSUZ_E01155 [Eucalyptus grandis]|uniref:Uncharacterized protein n=2 Tax=Eucalyptus grandis TaxID=71139 RepID=A0ACC3KUF8_EUCGR|nr:hypothetical protein EUGRSUZ_E01155 [Eucalyptus grandis]